MTITIQIILIIIALFSTMGIIVEDNDTKTRIPDAAGLAAISIAGLTATILL